MQKKNFYLETFGNSKAAIILNKILLERGKKQQNKCGHLFTRFSTILNELKKLNSRIALSVALLVYTKFKRDVDNYPDDEVRTFLKNVFSKKYKEFLKELKGQNPYKSRTDHPNNLNKK